MAFDLHEWYKTMNDNSVIFAYQGSITAQLITGILDTIEAKLMEVNENSKVRKKVYNVLVEALQNLYHHIDKTPNKEESNLDEKFAIFAFSRFNNFYKISTGNFVIHSKMQFIKDRLDQINYLTKEELKKLYRMILNNQEFTEKGGGGLGMIDIAKKTGNKLEYKFHKYNENYYFFSLDVLIT